MSSLEWLHSSPRVASAMTCPQYSEPPFVRSANYIGPCRRRRANPNYAGPWRRKDDQDIFNVDTPPESSGDSESVEAAK